MPSAEQSYRYITRLPGVRGGNAIVSGTRIGVHDVVGLLQNGETLDSIVATCFPDLTSFLPENSHQQIVDHVTAPARNYLSQVFGSLVPYQGIYSEAATYHVACLARAQVYERLAYYEDHRGRIRARTNRSLQRACFKIPWGPQDPTEF